MVYAHIVAVRPVIAGASAREGDNAIVGRINRRALRRGDVQPAVVIRAPARDALIIRHREHQLAGTGRAAQRAHLYDFGHGLHQRLFADYGAALLLPVLAAALLTVHRLTRGYGPYFLPQPVQDLFSHRWLEWLAALALLLYLALQRDRAFRRALGALAAWSAGALAAAALFSFPRGGYLSLYLSSLAEQVLLGFWDGPLYWLNGWLVLVCAALSAWAVVRTLAASRAEASALRLKGNLMMESYRALEAKLREGAAARHETAHRLTAPDALYQTGDWAGLGRLLEELGEQNARLSRTAFSPNFAVNAILQDAEARARAAGIRLEVRADVPEQLPVPVEDLCALLMNLLDNALEAAARVEVPGERFIRFRAAVKDGYFAVRCENSYAGPLAPDERGRLRTTKADPEAHGFGLPQMSAVAEKYGSLLDVSYTDRVFTVQTALKLPAAQASA